MSLDARARIVIEAVTRQAIADMQKTGAAVKGVADQTKQQTGILQGAGQAWKSMLVGIGAATAALYTAKKAFDFGREGAEILELRGAFSSLASEAGQSSNAIVAAIKRGADGTISQMDAISTATRVMNLGIASTPEEFEKLANVAETLGDRLGMNTAQSIDRVSGALTSLMPRALRSAGITADAEGVWKAYAKTLGTTADKLTDAQKRTALLDDANRRLGTGTESAADSFDRLVVGLKEVTDELKIQLAEAILPLVSAYADYVTASNDVETAAAAADIKVSGVRQGMVFLADGTRIAAGSFVGFANSVAESGEKFQDGGLAVQGFGGEIEGLSTTLADYSLQIVYSQIVTAAFRDALADGIVSPSEVGHIRALADEFGIELPKGIDTAVEYFNILRTEGIDPATASAKELDAALNRAMRNRHSNLSISINQTAIGSENFGPWAPATGPYAPTAGTSTKPTTQEVVVGGRLQHGGQLSGVNLVGEVGPEMVINGIVIPTSTTRQLLKLGLVPDKTMLLGGGFDTSQKGSYQKTTIESKEFLGTTSAAEAFGVSTGGAQAAVQVEAAVQAASQQVAAEIAPAITSAVVSAQAGTQVAAAQISEATARTIAATAETNALLRELLEITERQGDSSDVGRAVRDGLSAVEG